MSAARHCHYWRIWSISAQSGGVDIFEEELRGKYRVYHGLFWYASPYESWFI